MAAHGYFGKIPSARDFVFHGLPTRTTVAWADHMAGWLTAGRKLGGDTWKTSFLTSPVWRFVVPAGIAGAQGWVGLLAGSVDEVGREFPFAVMIGTDVDPAETQPIAALDPGLDRAETHMLEFMEGQAQREALLESIEAAATDIRRDLSIPNGRAPRSILPRDDEGAVCLTGTSAAIPGSGFKDAFGWPSAARGAYCLWWHEGAAGRPPEICVSRGVPTPRCAASFFLGDWSGHGWAPRDPADYVGNG